MYMAFVNWLKTLWMSTNAAPFRRSASVILMEPLSGKVLFCVRGSRARFMPGAVVFPGGLVEPEDESFPVDRLATPESHRNVTGDLLATRVCAARELFEECGILPVEAATGPIGSKWLSVSDHPWLADWQKKVRASPATFRDLYGPDSETGDRFNALPMYPFSRWLTPSTYPQRFDTEFVLMIIDHCPKPHPCTEELAAVEWATPSEVIRRSLNGEMRLPPPQMYELSRLQKIDFNDDHWMRFAGYDRICPQLIDIDDNRMLLVLPGDNMYKTENAEWVPMRKLPYAATHDNKNSALHRIEFAKKPQWSNWKIIVQNCPDRPVDL